MAAFGVILALIGLGYVIYVLVLPFLFSSTRRRIRELEQTVRRLERSIDQLHHLKATEGIEGDQKMETEAEHAKPSAEMFSRKTSAVRKLAEEHKTRIEEYSEGTLRDKQAESSTESEDFTIHLDSKQTPIPPASADIILRKIKNWLVSGNLVARVGIIVLFFGFSFFLKYAADKGWLPIEFRLASAALSGIALTFVGWWLRSKRKNYGLILQGGGVGIIYLSIFASVTLYELLPAGFGLVLIITLVVLSGALAVLQNARNLAVLATIGGFLAPVLISRGGSHVHLFLYYCVLDFGILGIAWFRSWRELNLVGFFFTFVISSIWGYRFYKPEFYTSTQPFLIIFSLIYIAVPILFAFRQSRERLGYVDGSLVFGVPLISFGLQSALVRDFEYGLAFSALIAGLFYAILAIVLWYRRLVPMKMLTEVFLALAVVFGTITIPFAIDGRWTGAAWALEGAALIWIGVRQKRFLSLLSGLIIQIGAGVSFLTALNNPTADVPVCNSIYLGAVMISVAGFISSYLLYRYAEVKIIKTKEFSPWVLCWGLLWWFGAGFNEIGEHVHRMNQLHAALLFIVLSLSILTLIRRRIDWQHLSYPIMFMLPSVLLIMLIQFFDLKLKHPLMSFGIIAWPLTIATQFWILKRFESEWLKKIIELKHQTLVWLTVFILSWECSWIMDRLIPESATWSVITWGLVPSLIIMLIPKLSGLIQWPIKQYINVYTVNALMGLALFDIFWTVSTCFLSGNPKPLHYLPLLNPLELIQLFVMFIILSWSREYLSQARLKIVWFGWGAIIFIVVNGIIARSVHFIGSVPFHFEQLWDSAGYQTTLSITWTICALTLMVIANRLLNRPAWITGASLLGIVVCKLFLVDLAGVGTVARIVTFLVVGALILLIGYLSPLPPLRIGNKTGDEMEYHNDEI